MTETNEPSQKFLGTYFDRDVVMRLSRWAKVASWVVLALYLVTWVTTFTQFLVQYSSGMFYNKGMTIFDSFNFFTPYLIQPIPGFVYFFSLQAIAHLLVIFLDVEENTRRAARK
jgi:hypothetical protein